MDPTFNPQNVRYIRFESDSEEDEEEEEAAGDIPATAAASRLKFVAHSKHPASAMFLGAVASTGEVSPPIWFPTGFSLDAGAYIKALRTPLYPG